MVLPCGSLPVEVADVLEAGLNKVPAALLVLQHGPHRTRQIGRIQGVQVLRGITADLRRGAAASAGNWDSAGHGFERREPKGLERRGRDEGPCPLIDAGEFPLL